MLTRTQAQRRARALTLACLIVCALFLTSCLFGRRADYRGSSEQADTQPHHYDADGFVWEGGRCHYVTGGIVYGHTGIDVSEYQDDIDWDCVAADGIDFAFLRLGFRGTTEGGLFHDERFDENLASAQAAGIACGAYFYSQATSAGEAREEAAFVLSVLDGRPLEYPVVFDHEADEGTRLANSSSAHSSRAVAAFCETIRAAGYEPMVYGNTYDLDRMGIDERDDYAVWCAEYDHDPSYAGAITVWQYTGDGVVAGIATLVDLNLYLGDVPLT